jgi:hypothetical protein
MATIPSGSESLSPMLEVVVGKNDTVSHFIAEHPAPRPNWYSKTFATPFHRWFYRYFVLKLVDWRNRTKWVDQVEECHPIYGNEGRKAPGRIPEQNREGPFSAFQVLFWKASRSISPRSTRATTRRSARKAIRNLTQQKSCRMASRGAGQEPCTGVTPHLFCHSRRRPSPRLAG